MSLNCGRVWSLKQPLPTQAIRSSTTVLQQAFIPNCLYESLHMAWINIATFQLLSWVTVKLIKVIHKIITVLHNDHDPPTNCQDQDRDRCWRAMENGMMDSRNDGLCFRGLQIYSHSREQLNRSRSSEVVCAACDSPVGCVEAPCARSLASKKMKCYWWSGVSQDSHWNAEQMIIEPLLIYHQDINHCEPLLVDYSLNHY